MLRVEVTADGSGKYYPVIAVKVWNLATIYRAWPLDRSPVWVPPFTLRFYPFRFKHVQLPVDWPEEYAESYFLIVTLWELGICDQPRRAASLALVDD